jgi:hypothetical protein
MSLPGQSPPTVAVLPESSTGQSPVVVGEITVVGWLALAGQRRRQDRLEFVVLAEPAA